MCLKYKCLGMLIVSLMSMMHFSEGGDFGKYYEVRVGGKEVRVQIALTEEEHEVGLMKRESLGKDEGMLFVFKDLGYYGFWMKNTPLKLSLGYFNEGGELLEVYEMEPFSERVIPSKQKVLYALEMPADWFKINNVQLGDKLDVQGVKKVQQQKDHDQEKFK